ncbi:nuclear transport factor 2 family protein [Sphingobium sp. YR768]|uniref:nuclear transport factor 2 family protein n=1 Tax=Sphingobium sp. YR768 TaxID=1884365 RepID=UPI0008B4793F|nr:nuclear transport factor 2 family protein [Sphingobium sp. YR768]SES15646.1 SnoaL-like domain-containing protein [Sphingobium sp. YR768]
MITNHDMQITIDRAEIQNVLARYCRGIDRLDEELLKAVYHPDANDDHGVFNGNAYEFIEMVLPLLKDITSGGSHMLFQSQIDVVGDRAAAETYFLAYQRMRGGRSKIEDYYGPTYAAAATKVGTIDEDHEYIAGGRYVDQLTRRNGEWRIQARIVMNEWGQCGPIRNVTDEGMIQHNIRLGSTDRSDPVYGAFAWLREPALPDMVIA